MLVQLQDIEDILRERLRRATDLSGLGSDRARMKQKVRANEISEILGKVRKLKGVKSNEDRKEDVLREHQQD